ncbi:MAG TPA: endo alpha-1,4 polygalactosaminidase, partial [Acidimicrobiales bacterium]|nr:endo alpha-1,4 polygalactosaminidase [Acidimicrobiales bacterium]
MGRLGWSGRIGTRVLVGLVLLAASVAVAMVGGVAPAGAATWWVPPLGHQPWQWELSNPLDLRNAKEMGTDDKLPDGKAAPAPVIYDIDAIINPRTTVAALHAMGKHVVCYVEVGAAGNYYSAAQEGTAVTYYAQLEADGDFGAKVPGYPEYYLDIRKASTLSIVESMIDRQCSGKGFDAVETDIDDEYDDPSGFPLTRAEEESYMTTLAGYIHGLGMGWWIKNPDDTEDNYASTMEPLADAVLTEQCNQYD